MFALQALVRRYLRRADRIVAIGETMRSRLVAKGARADRIAVIPNWVDTSVLVPAERDNPWAREHGLDGGFVVMHSGNVGHAQDLDALIRAATLLREVEDVVVAIVGGGARHDELVALARSLDAGNVRFLPYQPREVLSQSLSAADVHVVGLARGLAGYVVPSRLYGVLAVARPVIVAADAESETRADRRARGLRRRGAAGPARSARGRDQACPRRRARPRRDGQTRPGVRHGRGRPAHRRGSLPHTAGGIAMRESRLVTPLFLAAVFCSTFEKVHWNVAGTVYLADVTTLVFLAVWGLDRAGHHGRRVPRTAGVLLLFLVGFLLVYLIGFFNLDTQQAAAQFGKGVAKWLIHFVFLIVAVIYLAGHSRAFYWRTLAWFFAGITFNAVYGILQLGAAQAGHNLDSFFIKPLTRGASQINVYGAVGGSNVYRPNALTGDPNHLGIMLLVPLLVLSPIYLRLERRHRLRLPLAFLIALLLLVELATLSRSALLGLAVGALVLAVPYRHLLWTRAAALPLALAAVPVRVRAVPAVRLLRDGHPLAVRDERQGDDRALRRLLVHPGRSASAPAVRARVQQLLRLLRVRHRQDELGAALVLRRAARRGRPRRDAAVRRVPAVRPAPARRRAPHRPLARGGGQSRGRACAAAGVGDDRGAARDDGGERLLPDALVLLLLRLRRARAGDADRVAFGHVQDSPRPSPNFERR